MQRKKKPTKQQCQKVLAAQYRKDFFRKLKLIIDAGCGTEIFPLIPQRVLDDTYIHRVSPFRIIVDENSCVPSVILNNSKILLPILFRKHFIALPRCDMEITLCDYFTVFQTIINLDFNIAEGSFCNAHKVKEALRPLVADKDTFIKANKLLYEILYSFNVNFCSLQKALYWFKYDLGVSKTYPARLTNVITIYSITPETISVEIDKVSRPAIRVGWAFAYTGPNWLSLKPVDIGVTSTFAELPLKVYIQSHAINRLFERIDCFWIGAVYFNLYFSLASPKIEYDINKNLLIEFRIFNVKAGYFRADIVDGIILIRTFLFVTNNGTPEGMLLESNTGLQKLDKKYLAIDRLSTFVNSDLDKNEEVQQLFINSGCQCLFDFYSEMKPLLITKDKCIDASTVLSYLNKCIG